MLLANGLHRSNACASVKEGPTSSCSQLTRVPVCTNPGTAGGSGGGGGNPGGDGGGGDVNSTPSIFKVVVKVAMLSSTHAHLDQA